MIFVTAKNVSRFSSFPSRQALMVLYGYNVILCAVLPYAAWLLLRLRRWFAVSAAPYMYPVAPAVLLRPFALPPS